MKSLAFFVFLFFAVPGSGQMVWDGLPFSTRAEFATLVVIVTALASSEIRGYVRNRIVNVSWHGLIKPLLVLFCVTKFLTFAWSPMSAGFEACYRSIYNPLPNPNGCEKSFEGPLLPRGGTGFDNTSRVDAVVDFGQHPYDWSLPFMNDYPRLGNLWLSRFPFDVTYAARATATESDSVLPIFSIGELEVSVNGEIAAQNLNYDRHTLTAVRLPKGASEITFRYRYSDDELSVIPDTAPLPRGPYAALKVGAPQTIDDLYRNSKILIYVSTTSPTNQDLLRDVKIRDKNQRLIAYNNLNEQPREQADEWLKPFDFEVAVPASLLLDSPLEVIATRNDSTFVLGTITANEPLGLKTSVRQSPDIGEYLQLDATLTVSRGDLDAFRPATRSSPNFPLRLLLVILDMVALAILGFLTFSIVRTAGLILVKALALAMAAWLLIYPFDSIIPSFLGGGREFVLPYALLCLFIFGFRRQILSYPLVSLLPVSSVLASQKVFDHLYFNHPGEQINWWGKLIFLWRDSDWFANQGNARAILVEGSLRGGESVFWFRAAPRYLLASLHFLLGENDVLVGLVSLALGFLIVWILAATFIARHESSAAKVVGWFMLFISLIFLGDQLTTAFAFFVSSEYPTWLIFLGLTAFLLREPPESRIWVTSLLSALLAMTFQFRPNGLFVAFALFPLILMKSDRSQRDLYWKQVAWAVIFFFIVLSANLIHNLYYGQQFEFITSASNLHAVSFSDALRDGGPREIVRVVLTQLRGVMYWRVPHDPNFAIFFWGSQLILVGAVAIRSRYRLLRTSTMLIAFIPFTYAIPMLTFQLNSYYPRLLVTASLLCLCSGLLLWPGPAKIRAE